MNMHQTMKTLAKWTDNPFYNQSFNEKELAPFSPSIIDSIQAFQQTHPAYTYTPLVSLRGLAHYVGIDELFVKDESLRFGLQAFKVMGGIYGIAKCLADRLGRDIRHLSFEELRSPAVKKAVGELTFISATDGNHGFGVAWVARELGHQSVIYLPKGSSSHQLKKIRQEGAKAHITEFNYDDTVRMCDSLAKKNNWILVQDTAWEDYDKIPLWIMQGYAVIAKEIVEQVGTDPPTHVFLQAGVGSFAAAIAAYLIQYYRDSSPMILIVEPNQADCYYRSFRNGDGFAQTVEGDLNAIMAGLACGKPNTRAWRILSKYSKAAFSCGDSLAALGMRILGNPFAGDVKITSGESGAVTTGLLYYLQTQKGYAQVKKEIGLDQSSRVLLINTEWATSPERYREVVWHGAIPLN